MGFLASFDGCFLFSSQGTAARSIWDRKNFMNISALFKLRQAALYGFIGLSAVIVDYAVFFVSHNAFHWNTLVATAISVSVATVYAFFLNAYFNFRKTDQLFARFLSYFAVSGIGLLISVLILFIFSERIGFDPNIVKAISIPFIVALQYVLNVLVSFSQTTFERKTTVNNQGQLGRIS